MSEPRRRLEHVDERATLSFALQYEQYFPIKGFHFVEGFWDFEPVTMYLEYLGGP